MKILLLLLTLAQTAAAAEGYAFDVRHDHALGDCRGRLILEDTAVRYETDEDHSREWSYPDVESFEIVSPSEIRVHTYESEGFLRLRKDRHYTFLLEGGALDADVYRFLQARSPRPVRTRVVFDSGNLVGPEAGESVLQEMGARHGHFLGGCQGTLTIAEDRITYATEHAGHSRVWRLADVESFASTGDFDLRISTAKETFHFDLKVPLKRETYAHLWNRVYEPQIQTYGGRRQ